MNLNIKLKLSKNINLVKYKCKLGEVKIKTYKKYTNDKTKSQFCKKKKTHKTYKKYIKKLAFFKKLY